LVPRDWDFIDRYNKSECKYNQDGGMVGIETREHQPNQPMMPTNDE